MTATLTFESSFGHGTTITLPDNETAKAKLYLTDLPTPSGIELSINGKIVTQGSWSGANGYEMFFPITNLKDGKYVFQAIIFFATRSKITSNKATLNIVSEGSDLTRTVSPSTTSGTSAQITLTLPQKIAIGVGLVGGVGIGGLLIYKKVGFNG